MFEDHPLNFIESCLQGKTLPEDIDDFIDSWHESDSPEPLHEFLGMTWEEYSLWVSNHDMLPYIITAHKEETTVESIISSSNTLPMAARSPKKSQTIKLANWLTDNGKAE